MKKHVWVFGILLQLVFATPTFGVPCISQSLTAYEALGGGGCTVDGVTFADFVPVPPVSPGVVQIDPATVTLTPVTGPTGLGFAVSSSSAIVASSGEILQLWFGFNATPAGGTTFTGNSIALGEPAVTDDGAITLVEDKCADGTFASPSVGCSGAPVTLIAFAIEGLSDLEESSAVPASFFDVFADLVIDGGLVGSAALGPQLEELRFGVAQAPAPVPGPTALVLIAAALGALVGSRRLTSRRTRV